MRLFSSISAGLVLGWGVLLSPTAHAQSAPNYLQIHTADGQTIQAAVKAYKGIGQAVITSLVKDGKAKQAPRHQTTPPGAMTFYLDKGASASFLNWVNGSDSKASGSSATGTFQWVNSNGTVTETFNMTGVQVVSFNTAGPSGSSGKLVLVAGHIDANPPFNYK